MIGGEQVFPTATGPITNEPQPQAGVHHFQDGQRVGPCRQDQETARTLRQFSICSSTINPGIYRGTVAAKAEFSMHALGLLGRFAFRVLCVGHR